MIGLAAGDVAAAVPASARRTVARPRLALFAALLVFALMPVLTTPIPAMVDYVNHLARMYVLAAQGTPQASPFYHADWHPYPNLAMDLIVPRLARWTGVEPAARLFLLASQLLVVTGSLAIEWQVKRRFDIAGFAAVLFLFNPPFAWGFVNFEAALGVALWGIAAWLALRAAPWPARLATHTVFVVALLAGHMFALGLYGATLGLHELWACRRETRPRARLLGALLLLAAPAAVLAIALARSGGSVGGAGNIWQLSMKPLWPFALLNGDSMIVSVLGTIALLLLLYPMARRGEIVFVASGAWIAGGLAVLFLVLPGVMLDTAFADVRVLVGAVLILPAFLSVRFPDVAAARRAGLVVAGVTLVNVACVERVWQSYQPIYREMIASFGRLGDGARVLVADAGEADDPPFRDLAGYPLYHAPTLAVHYARAFVPTLFTTKGKQPLTVAPELERLSFSCGGPIPLAILREVAEKAKDAPQGTFVSNWTRDFDYVYVLGTTAVDPMPGVLERVARQASFALYRIRRASEARLSAPRSP